MKVGDLIRVSQSVGMYSHCPASSDFKKEECGCWFCCNDSNGIGIVVDRLSEEEVHHSNGYWVVMFDAGEWRLYGREMEVICENR